MPDYIYLMDILKAEERGAGASQTQRRSAQTRCISINHMTIQIMFKVSRKTETGDIICY